MTVNYHLSADNATTISIRNGTVAPIAIAQAYIAQAYVEPFGLHFRVGSAPIRVA
jgi:hypothetical protein